MATKKQDSLNTYVKEKHTQEECIGFIDGYEKAVNDFEELFEDMIYRLFDNDAFKGNESLEEILRNKFNNLK